MHLIIKPINLYEYPLEEKSLILKENNEKSGIYKLTNKITNESYIGSSTNLKERFENYFSKGHLRNKINKGKIYRNLLNYDISNFRLEILEYCDCNKKLLYCKEQYYIDSINPEYNILKIAGSSLGFKHSLETKLKLKKNNKKI